MSSLDSFIETERDHYATYDNNIFATALSQVTRYREFLSIILSRYEPAGATLAQSIAAFQASLSPGGGPLSTAQLAQLRSQRALDTLVHLEIESFYTFAKILLDRVALFIERYFGALRGTRLLSHGRLYKSFEAYAEQKQLNLPAGLLPQIASLERRVGHYRDKQISHHHNLRTARGTMIGTAGGPRIHSSPLYPKPEDSFAQSEDLADLVGEIDLYLELLISLVVSNRGRTALSLKEGHTHETNTAG